MGEKTGIEWVNGRHPNEKIIPGKTWNVWEGCEKVSPACKNCYAETRDDRFYGGKHWGSNSERLFHKQSYWNQPVKWDKWARAGQCWDCNGTGVVYQKGPRAAVVTMPPCETCGATGKVEPYRYRVFCASLADVFEDREDLVKERIRLFDLIRTTPNLDWLLLTKRPENVLPTLKHARELSAECQFDDGHEKCALTHDWLDSWIDGRAPENIWMGATAENQEWFDNRINYLTAIPAKYRFLSCEPLLGAIRLPNSVTGRCYGCQTCEFRGFHRIAEPKIHWVITGGESGADARMTHPDWVRGLRDQCVQAGIPFFHKQMTSDGKKINFDEWPDDLKIRESPNAI